MKVKPLISDDIRENKPALPDQRLRAVRHHTSKCFAKESEDVKESTIIAGYISRFVNLPVIYHNLRNGPTSTRADNISFTW